MTTELESTTLRERQLEGVPVVERRLMVAGAATVLLEGGDGPPVVLLHGPAANGAHWAGVLARPHRRPPRHRARPARPRGVRAVAPELMLEWLGELIERTCAMPPALVGAAAGGAIAARFAARHPDRLDRLVLVDTLGLRPFEPTPEFGAALKAFVGDPNERTHDDLWRRCALDLDACASAWASAGRRSPTTTSTARGNRA